MIVYSKDRKKYLVDFTYDSILKICDDIWSSKKEKAGIFENDDLDFIKEVYCYDDLEIEY